MNPKPDQFDHLLDQALYQYTPAQAHPHLEEHLQVAIHTALKAQPKARVPQPLWRLVLPLAAVILISVLATLYSPRHSEKTNQADAAQPPLPATPGTQQKKQFLVAQGVPGKTSPKSAIRHLHMRSTQPSIPSTTVKLTEQEQQLFQLATLDPNAAQSILNLQANRDELHKIKPIQIYRVPWTTIQVQRLDIPPIEMATRQPPTRPSSF